MSLDQLFLYYAKEGIFLALFLYLLNWTIPKMRQEFKQEMKEMEERHKAEIGRVEKNSESRESELIRLLTMFEDKYDILTYKVEKVLKKLKD